MAQHTRILVGASAGVGLGLGANLLAGGASWLNAAITYGAVPAGQIFLRLLFMLVIPLVFSALVVGIAGLDLKQLGRLGGRMLGYTVVVSAVAVVIGLGLVNLLQPGVGLSDELRALARTGDVARSLATAPKAAPVDLLVQMIPDNPFKAAATGDMIGVIVFALLFGIGLAATRTEAAGHLRNFVQGLYDVMMRLIAGVLWLAPIGVGALLFAMTARLGLPLLAQLAGYVGVVILGLAIHTVVVYSLSVKLAGGMSPAAFFRGSRLAMVTAFSTASSSATLPTALKVAEENLGLPAHVSRFVLTAGSTMNQNGTALFEGVTVLFLAQVFQVDLSIGQQLLVMVICILAGIGTAGVPAGSLPVIAMILGMFGIPPEGIGLILGVDRLLDMCRTTVNVTGDLAAAVFVARGESAPPSPAAVSPDQ